MADYVDKEQLIEEYESYGSTSPIALTFIDYLKEMPAVDAVKVVRCKDCRYKDKTNKRCVLIEHYRSVRGIKFDDDFYCALGAKK